MTHNEPSEIEINKIVALVSDGLFQQALNDANSCLKNYPDNSLLLNISGACNAGLGKFDNAIKLYQKAIEIKPDYAKAHYNLAITFEELDQLDKAVKSYKKSIEIDPSYAESHNNLGNVYRILQQSEDAINSYKKAIKINPNYVEALYSLSNVIQDLDDQIAIDCLEKVTNINPKFIEAHNNLGILYKNQGRLHDAVQTYENAIALNSNFGEVHNNLGNVYRELGHLDEAIESYKKAISLKPDYPSTYNNLGNVLKDLDQFVEAIKIYEKALNINPDNFEILNNLGNAYTQIECFDDAIEVYEKALLISPDFVDALNNLGIAYKKIDRIDDAIEAYKKALEINPDFADALNNLGIAYKGIGQIDDAIETYEKALIINPNDSDTLNHIGIALIDSERLDEAVHCYKKVLTINPDSVDSLNNLAIAFMKLKRFDEAYKANEKALILRPNYPEGFAVQGRIFTEQKQLDKALESFKRATEINPNLDYGLGSVLNTKMNLCNWEDLPNLLKELEDKIIANQKVIVPFDLLGLIDSPMLQKKTSEIYANDKFPESYSLPKIDIYPKHSKIRIGYFSADFKEHPVSFLTAELYEIHDRDRFEIHAFSFGLERIDEMNLRIKSGVDYFHDVHKKSDKEIALLSRSMEIDIAIDLGGYTADSRTGIFAMRAAPIQASYIGVLSTMGSRYYDYLIAGDEMIPKQNQQYFSEKILYLPSYQVNDSKESIPEILLNRKDLGLPESGFVFCCLNNTFKITPEVFNSWMLILKKVAGSVLLIYSDSEIAKVNLRKEANKNGIDSERIIFGDNLPRAEYMARYKVADLFLDTHPYNAGTTASDALRMGLPIITLQGNSFNSREAESIIRAVNLPEMIVPTFGEYASRAIELANNQKKYELIKKKLASNLPNAPLFNTAKFVKNIESAYIKIYDNQHQGLGPDHVYIKDLNDEK